MGIHTSNLNTNIRTGRRFQKRLSLPANLFITTSETFIGDKYIISENLGSGAFSEVKLCIHKLTQEKRAVKIIHKAYLYLDQYNENHQLQEISILTSLVHPNILRCYEIFEDHFKFYLVTELCEGGTLFEKIKEFQTLNEEKVSSLIFQVLSALAYCHEDKNVIHRDLKPENILLEEKIGVLNIKISDFGSACYLDPGKKLQKSLGTPYYVAPEVVEGEYDEKCDVWSCGIILYMLLTGKAPYQGTNVKSILKNLKTSPFVFNEVDHPNISPHAVDLLKKMLVIDPKLRIPASEALNHPWFQSDSQTLQNTKDLTESLKHLAKFTSTSKLKDAVYTYLVTQIISKDELHRLTAVFKMIDVNGDGKITKAELVQQYVTLMGKKNAVKIVESIMAQVDSDQNGDIDYVEFLKGCMDYERNLSKENLKRIFSVFDQDDNGEITLDEIKSILGNQPQLTDSAWEDMMREVDKNHDGKIDLCEFIRYITS